MSLVLTSPTGNGRIATVATAGVASTADLGYWVVSFWFRVANLTTAASNNITAWGTTAGGASTAGVRLRWNNATTVTLLWYYLDNGVATSDSLVITPTVGEWHHVCVLMLPDEPEYPDADKKIRVLLDGVQVKETQLTGTSQLRLQTDGVLTDTFWFPAWTVAANSVEIQDLIFACAASPDDMPSWSDCLRIAAGVDPDGLFPTAGRRWRMPFDQTVAPVNHWAPAVTWTSNTGGFALTTDTGEIPMPTPTPTLNNTDIGGNLPVRVPRMTWTPEARSRAFYYEVERKVTGADDATAVSLGAKGRDSYVRNFSGYTVAGGSRQGPFEELFDVSLITPGTAYSYRVRPVDTAGVAGAWSAWADNVQVRAHPIAAQDARIAGPYSTDVQPPRSPSRLHLLAQLGINRQGSVPNDFALNGGCNEGYGYSMATWKAGEWDTLEEFVRQGMNTIFRFPWGGQLRMVTPGASSSTVDVNNYPAGINYSGTWAVSGGASPFHNIRRSHSPNTLYELTSPPVTQGVDFKGAGYWDDFKDVIRPLSLLGYRFNVYTQAPPSNAVSTDWDASLLSGLFLRPMLEAGCGVVFDTSPDKLRNPGALYPGLGSLSPVHRAWDLLFARQFECGGEPIFRPYQMLDFLGYVQPNLVHMIHERWNDYLHNHGSGNDQYVDASLLRHSSDSRRSQLVGWLRMDLDILSDPLDPASPTTQLTTAQQVYDWVMRALEGGMDVGFAGAAWDKTLGDEPDLSDTQRRAMVELARVGARGSRRARRSARDRGSALR